jgi:diketogulonate reductase-like aldo/keto reductase
MPDDLTLTLNNGVVMPALGLGVFQTPAEETRAAVEAELAAGHRHIDTAASYGNERQVAEAVQRIAENIDVFDFDLTTEELAAIDALDTGRRGGPEPEAITLESFGRPIPED